MAKAFVQDVVPPRRSVRQIVVASGGTEKSPSMQHAPLEEGGGGVRSRGRSFSPPSFGRRRSSKGIWLIALSALVFLYLTFAIFFAGAKVTITPRQEATVINGSFVAKQNPVLSELPFETMTVFLEKTATVPATGEKYLEQKASGIITIYNDYNNAPLRLIKNTRFESPGGLIYRIANSVVVPPQEIVDGVKKPGMIDAEIYADTAGAEYDLASGLFTIPGLKDSPQFSRHSGAVNC